VASVGMIDAVIIHLIHSYILQS